MKLVPLELHDHMLVNLSTLGEGLIANADFLVGQGFKRFAVSRATLLDDCQNDEIDDYLNFMVEMAKEEISNPRLDQSLPELPRYKSPMIEQLTLERQSELGPEWTKPTPETILALHRVDRRRIMARRDGWRQAQLGVSRPVRPSAYDEYELIRAVERKSLTVNENRNFDAAFGAEFRETALRKALEKLATLGFSEHRVTSRGRFNTFSRVLGDSWCMNLCIQAATVADTEKSLAGRLMGRRRPVFGDVFLDFRNSKFDAVGQRAILAAPKSSVVPIKYRFAALSFPGSYGFARDHLDLYLLISVELELLCHIWVTLLSAVERSLE